MTVRQNSDSESSDQMLQKLQAQLLEQEQQIVELKNSRDMLKTTLEAVPDLLFEVGLDGQCYFCHAPVDELLYAPTWDIIGKKIPEVVPEPVSTIVMSAIDEASRQGLSFGKCYELQVPKGLCWFEVSVSRKAGDAEEARFILLVRDITTRKKAEEALLRNNKIQIVLREIAEAAGAADSLNELCAAIYPLVEGVLPAKNFHINLLDEENGHILAPYYVDENHVVPPLRPIRKGLSEYAMRQGKAIHLNSAELDQMKQTGEATSTFDGVREWMGVPLRDSAGKVFGVVVLYIDKENQHFDATDLDVLVMIAAQIAHVLERQQLEEELKRTDEALDQHHGLVYALFETLPVGVFLAEAPSGKPLLMNKEAMRLLGQGIVSDATIENISEVYRAHRTGSHEFYPLEEIPLHLGLHGDSSYVDDMEIVRPDGTRTPVEVFGSPVKDHQGNVWASLVSFIDISGRKQAEIELRRSNEIQNVLREIAEAAVSAASTNELYEKVHRTIGRILPAENFYIALLDEARGQIVRPYCVDNMYFLTRERPIGKGLTEYVMQLGNVLHATQADLDLLRQSGTVSPLDAPAHDYLGAPLKDQANKCFGVIAVNSAEPFAPGDAEILSIIAAQVAMAIERKRAEDELKCSEQALQRQNALFTALFKTIPIGVFMAEAPSGKPLMANNAAQKLLGRGILPDVSRSNLAEVYEAYKAGGQEPYPVDEMPILLGMSGQESHIDDMEVVRPDGSKVLLEIFGSPVTDENGQVWGSLASFFDITDRKQAEVLLRNSEEKFRQLIKTLPLPLTLINHAGEFTFVNDRFVQVFGYEYEEIPTVSVWRELAFPDEQYRQWVDETWAAAVEKALAEKADITPTEREITCKNGMVRTVIVSGTVLGDSVLATFTDISDQRRHERALQESYERRRKKDLMNELIRKDIPTGLAVFDSERILGPRAKDPFTCILIVLDSYQNKPRADWLEALELYQPMKDWMIDSFSNAERIVWETPEGIGMISFEITGPLNVKTRQILLAEALRDAIVENFPELSIIIGIGEQAITMKEIGVCYRQASEAASSGRKVWPRMKIYHYSDMGAFQILSSFNDEAKINDYIDRTLGKLMKKSKKNEAFLESLEIILMSDNLKARAVTLGVHYNTLMFRKRRLEEILEVSFEDYNSRMAILTALNLLKLRKK